MKRLQFSAVLASAAVLLGACGEPLASEEEAVEAGNTVTAFDILPPSAALDCHKTWSDPTVTCTGSASNGVAPYTYQWRYSTGTPPTTWYNDTPELIGYCKTGLFTGGGYYNLTIDFRVIDANGYVSNEVRETFRGCWRPYPN